MSGNTICKTIRQYNKEPVSMEDMCKLLEIADDYGKVKNYVYQRYGGIKSIEKLYPGYTVQNEMTASGLRESLSMPSVYFYLAVYDALGDIKSHWSKVKKLVQESVHRNENFTPKDKHYLRFILKVNNCFESVLNDKPLKLPDTLQKKYEEAASDVDIRRLDNYLKRQVRRHLKKLHTDETDGFSISERAYRYGDHGIYISVKEKRKRIYIPLTDSNQYDRQLFIRLFKESGRLEIFVPIKIRVKRHGDFQNEVGIAFGMFDMLTTDSGNIYGEQMGEYVRHQAEWIQEQNRIYRNNKDDNPGRKRYEEQKRKMDERLHTYINAELNRFFRTEKPKTVYFPKLPARGRAGKVKRINFHVAIWQKGYIKERFLLKCREHSVAIVEVFGKGIGIECSECGKEGQKKKGLFLCPACGFQERDRVNAARNARKRGEKEQLKS